MREFVGIKCPYCFKTFDHDQVHFRLAQATVNEAQKIMNRVTTDEEKEIFKSYSKLENIDSKFFNVWGPERGGDLMGADKDLFFTPYIDEDNVQKMTLQKRFLCDEDGFVERIQDDLSNFESKIRICPHCHNRLPERYGKHEQKFISILGVSSSGKTVFIKQLMAKLRSSGAGILSYVNGSLQELIMPADDNDYLEEGTPLPKSTTTHNFKVPYFITVSFNKDGNIKTYDLVIYDVAGETLIVNEENSNRFKFFAGFIKVSDAIITLIDPMQLVSDPKPEYPANKMLTTLYRVFGTCVKVPTAITLSKSDLLLTSRLLQQTLNRDERYFNQNSPITQNINWNMEKKYFYDDVYQSLRGQLTRFFREIAQDFDQGVRNQFECANYFAISSLLDGVDLKLILELVPNRDWKSQDMGTFAESFSVLKEELMLLQDDLKEQENNPDEDIIDINSIFVEKAFVFDQSSDDCRRMDEILGRISELATRVDMRNAVYAQFPRGYKIHLVSEDGAEVDMDVDDFIGYIYKMKRGHEDYNFNMFLQGYPRRDGHLESLRIEEPVFWLFAEMGLINRGRLNDTRGRGSEGETGGVNSESGGFIKKFKFW